jgi:hypothetical protein
VVHSLTNPNVRKLPTCIEAPYRGYSQGIDYRR